MKNKVIKDLTFSVSDEQLKKVNKWFKEVTDNYFAQIEYLNKLAKKIKVKGFEPKECFIIWEFSKNKITAKHSVLNKFIEV